MTPDTLPEGDSCQPLYLPDDDYWRACFLGALELLADADHWETYGSITPEATASRWFEVYSRFDADGCGKGGCGGTMSLPVGVIVPSAVALDAPDFLPCDGSQVLQATYADLYAAISDTFGSADEGYFRLPDLRGRTAIGTGQGSGLTNRALADTGGAETHVLTLSEMPQHRHQYYKEPTADEAGRGFGGYHITGAAALNYTTYQGGDTAHQNMQPWLALHYFIVATAA